MFILWFLLYRKIYFWPALIFLLLLIFLSLEGRGVDSFLQKESKQIKKESCWKPKMSLYDVWTLTSSSWGFTIWVKQVYFPVLSLIRRTVLFLECWMLMDNVKDQQANLTLEKQEMFFQCWAWLPLTDAVLQGKDSEEVNCHSWKPRCWGRLAFWKLSQGNHVLKASGGDWKAVSSDRKEQDRELFRSDSLPILTFRWTPFCLTKKTHISLHPTALFTLVIMRARCVPGLVWETAR